LITRVDPAEAKRILDGAEKMRQCGFELAPIADRFGVSVNTLVWLARKHGRAEALHVARSPVSRCKGCQGPHTQVCPLSFDGWCRWCRAHVRCPKCGGVRDADPRDGRFVLHDHGGELSL
jgi:hypothetical protein